MCRTLALGLHIYYPLWTAWPVHGWLGRAASARDWSKLQTVLQVWISYTEPESATPQCLSFLSRYVSSPNSTNDILVLHGREFPEHSSFSRPFSELFLSDPALIWKSKKMDLAIHLGFTTPDQSTRITCAWQTAFLFINPIMKLVSPTTWFMFSL